MTSKRNRGDEHLSPRFALRAVFAIAVMMMCAVSSIARANGKFPSAGMLVEDPSDPNHFAVVTTFGVMVTRNGGADMHLICEEGAGYVDTEPGIAITASGLLIAGMLNGVGLGLDNGCNWQLATGAIANRIVADVSLIPSTPSSAVAVTVTQDGAGTRVWRSDDDGTTWDQLGNVVPSTFIGNALEVAPSDDARIYITGTAGIGGAGRIARSDDAGVTWQVFDVPGSVNGADPFLSGIDPGDPDRVYVRLNGNGGRLLVTEDGGASFQTVFTAEGFVKGFALSPDGATVLIGGYLDGIWRATVGEWDFEQLTDVGVLCMRWTNTGVYACTDEADAGYTVGLSTDAGTTFQALFHLPCLRGPLECGADTTVGGVCPAAFDKIAPALDVKEDCLAPPNPTVTVSAGPGGTSVGGGGAGGASATGGSGGESGGGCGCAVAGDPTRHSSAWALVVLGIGLALKRRRLVLAWRS